MVSTTIKITPREQILAPEISFTISVDVAAVADLGAYNIVLRYDSDILLATAAADSIFAGYSPTTYGPTITAGRATFGAYIGSSPGPNGPGTLATLTLKTLKRGISPLTPCVNLLDATAAATIDVLGEQSGVVRCIEFEREAPVVYWKCPLCAAKVEAFPSGPQGHLITTHSASNTDPVIDARATYRVGDEQDVTGKRYWHRCPFCEVEGYGAEFETIADLKVHLMAYHGCS